jgi:hypothetical protein
MRTKLWIILMIPLLLAGLSFQPAARANTPSLALTNLKPGEFSEIEQDLTVNVVFVGYEQGAGYTQIDEGGFLSELPASYRAVNRIPSLYLGSQYLGLKFNYQYNLVFAGSDYEDAFFGYLSSIAVAKPRTLYQDLYNGQVHKSGQVSKNYWIDAPSVEQWLADNTSSSLGVDTSQYTVFFINWYGRADFKYHVYTKTDEPDPDTGWNFGEVTSSRKMIAWGGTTPDDEENGLGSLHRIWFYDLSAGPEGWSDNWNVDDLDPYGSNWLQYRMPPVWEYGNLGAYRPFDNLSGDLGKVTRYIAINLLFTPSPLYNPSISPPLVPEMVQLDINVYQGEPGVDAKDFFDQELIRTELNELQPLKTYSLELTDLKFSGRAREVYECFLFGPSCYGYRLWGISFGDLFLFHQDQLLRFLEGDGDYEIPIFAYNLPSEVSANFLGFADDDWSEGMQSFVFAFDSPLQRERGYGFTTTAIHETGHHIGMSHPHDGYDAELDYDYLPEGDLYFVWTGDEVNSMMSYIDLNWDFSQFDRDNMNRFLTAIYINQANTILHKVSAHPHAYKADGLLASADDQAGLALAAYADMDYLGASAYAKAAYAEVVRAAALLKIKIEPQAWQADYKSKGISDKFVDTLTQRLKP